MSSRRSPTRGRPGGRSPSGRGRAATSSGASGQPLLVAGAGAVVLIAVVLFVVNRGNDAANAGSNEQTPAAAPQRPVSGPAVSVGSSRAGKTPTKAPPELTQATLQELSDLLAQATQLVNEGKQARTGRGENQVARDKMTEASAVLAEWERKVAGPLRWQEDAQMEEWAQPAEYVALEQLYATFAKLQKEARMGGGSNR